MTKLTQDPSRARRDDPETSKAAALAVQGGLRASQARVLSMFRLYGDMTDETLLKYLHEAEKSAGMKLMSASGCRTRRSELAKANEDRIDELVKEWLGEDHPAVKTGRLDTVEAEKMAEAREWARARLRDEGIRAPLWDTGRREKLASGRMAIVWGIAR